MKIFPSVASDLYGKLTYDDVDCQKKIICEFMDEPEMFGEQSVPKTSVHQKTRSMVLPYPKLQHQYDNNSKNTNTNSIIMFIVQE